VPEFTDPVFAKTIIENERFGLVFAKTGSMNSGTGELQPKMPRLFSILKYRPIRYFVSRRCPMCSKSLDAVPFPQGEYTVDLPDGRVQVVSYVADHDKGFMADVKYVGEARQGAGHVTVARAG
jgi:hypothetical protein